VKRDYATLCLALVACGSYIPESELPVARDLDCSEKIEVKQDGGHTIATGCGRTKRYRCKVDEDTGERFCIARGDERYGANSDTWVKGTP
jgi:hypothetical protein